MTAQAQRDAAFDVAKTWISQEIGWEAFFIPDSDLQSVVDDILAAPDAAAAFTAARARINALAGSYAARITDADVQQLCQVVIGGMAPPPVQPKETES